MYADSCYFGAPQEPADPIMPPSLVDSSSSNDCMLENNAMLPSFTLDSPYAGADMALNNLHHQLGFDIMHDIEAAAAAPTQLERTNWDICFNDQLPPSQNQHIYPDPTYLRAGAAVPDLLNLLELPRCTKNLPLFPSSISFDGMSMLYEPMVGGDNPGAPQPGVLRDLFGSLPQNYGLFGGLEDREGGVMGGGEGEEGFEEMGGRRQFDGVLDYRRAMMKGEKKENFPTEKQRRVLMKGKFTELRSLIPNPGKPTEKQRRVLMKGKFTELRSLIPNPGKDDRASTVEDAIQYINELLRTRDELKLLVEKKQRRQERSKRQRGEEDAVACNMESSTTVISGKDDVENTINGPLRSSWLQRRSKETFVDVRIIEDEVNIKLTQKKKVNTLLLAAKALDELQLELNHVAGGNIGDYHIFMFNAKICEGSSVYGGAVANKLLEAMARHNMTQQFMRTY